MKQDLQAGEVMTWYRRAPEQTGKVYNGQLVRIQGVFFDRHGDSFDLADKPEWDKRQWPSERIICRAHPGDPDPGLSKLMRGDEVIVEGWLGPPTQEGLLWGPGPVLKDSRIVHHKPAKESSPDLGPLETMVNGEPHITLTGWQPKDMDYSVLKGRPDTVVLQMANDDVTDRTLENLRGLKKLRVLDLANTQVTDEGLSVLKEFPNLEVLFLNRTKITDAGVRQNVFAIDSLKELNVRNTQVTKKTRDEWKAAREGRKVTPAY
jgi:hypothetical protein